MPIPTPFHKPTSRFSESQEWQNWSGYLSAVTYESYHEREYYAIRNSAALIDVTPLYKYEIIGPDAELLTDRIMTRNVALSKVGQVMYSPWCDEEGKVIDDGTISRLEQDHFRITAADPSLRWFQDCGHGLNAEVVDVSKKLAALAIQGPQSRNILNILLSPDNLDKLNYYHLIQTKVDDIPLTITRTGFTGDLGYEIWTENKHAETLWERLYEIGLDYGIMPCGLAGLDIARIEAGLLLIDVDYISAHKALIPEQKSSPYEIGLGWTVQFSKSHFIGKPRLLEEKNQNPKWAFVGLDIDWTDLEKLFAKHDLPPQVSGRATRSALPIYKLGKQIGQATSITFSQILKKYISLASIETQYASLGDQVQIEITVEFERVKANAKIVKPQFFNPNRKRSIA